MKQRCMCCFNEYEEGISKCPHCGYSESEYEENQYHLPLRTVLKGRYIIGRSLGQGGFGITYAAWDSLLEKKVAIKEYLPTDFATRSVGSPTVKVFNMESAERFQKGMESFLGESRRLAKFATVPGVVGIYDCFNENSTAYIVMEYLEGKTLGQMVRQNGKLPYDKAVYIMLQVLNALDVVHQAGIIHRDIAPDNVFVCDDGRVKLLDFGAARFVTTSHSRSLSMILKMGYAPVEQYSSKGDQGTWTDVYACGATLYYAITGVQPVDSYDRMDETKDDKLATPSKYAKKLPKNVETAILNAMNIMPENRTQTAKAFADELEGTIDVKRVKEKLEHEDTGRIPAWMKANSVAAVIAAVAAVVLIAVGVSAVIVRSDKSNIPDGMTRVPNVVAQEADTAEETLNESTLKMVIGNRIFDSYYDKMSVIVQNPYAGGVAYQNSVVNVTLSGGTDNMVVMPDLSYYPQENAKELLESLGIFVQYEDGSDDIAAEGCVLKQSVKAGEYVKKGDSVILTVNKSDGLTDVSVSTEKVKVPDIVGMKMTEAANLLKESKLRISIVEAQYSDEHKAGTVLAQETKAQASVPAGTVINVTVSLGKQQYVVPDVLYMPEQNAKDRLTENSLQYKVLYEESDKVAVGVVLKQFPKFGKVVESQSVVTLTVSSGFKVTVPNVVGKKESDAKAALIGAGLGCKVVYEPSTTVKQGTVIRQSPKNGNKIEQGSVVEIVVSSGNNSISVTGVRLNIRSATLSRNEQLTLYATISPKNATNTVVSWSSSNSGVASVDGNGIVTANGVGSAVITVETADGGFTATCNITVVKSVVSISVQNPKTTYYTGQSFERPTVIATYDDGSTEDVTNKCVFNGFQNNNVGTFKINISYKYGKNMANTSYQYSMNNDTAYLNAEIINITAYGNEYPNYFISSYPSSYTLRLSLTSGNNPDNITWKSSDSSIATVNSSGVVTACSIGQCEIGAITENGLFDTCIVNVWTLIELSYHDDSVYSCGPKSLGDAGPTLRNSNYEKTLVRESKAYNGYYRYYDEVYELSSEAPNGIPRSIGSTYTWRNVTWTIDSYYGAEIRDSGETFYHYHMYYNETNREWEVAIELYDDHISSLDPRKKEYIIVDEFPTEYYRVGGSTKQFVSKGRALFE